MAINSDYFNNDYGMSRDKYDRMKYEQMCAMQNAAQLGAHLGFIQSGSGATNAAVAEKPKYLNPKLLLVKG